ncbi:MAG: lytic transglycosylase domain-containing protein [Phenylobacterium sp.]|uniref:lytic transglycosylase domain-containing protein n=1 Tax=Phenylobacterium sp. TaxID=1871053 RepID=UPI002736CD20|nr:lytic transglycosylase domain-containing protein [Phenylobacterium sp.]MDP3745454.1 lytic transglycosylase domain-containing protein [Phenylobacterium sp.]
MRPEFANLHFKARKAFLTATAAILVTSVAQAQPASTRQAYEGPPRPIELTQTPQTAYRQALSDADSAALRSALDAAKRADVTGARSAIGMIGDPIAKKIATWALVDAAAESLSFFEVDQARRDLAGWPRGQRRLQASERLLETSGQSPQRIVEWFGGGEPQTAEGAMALASAYQATGKPKEAAELIRGFWRNRIFEVAPQRAMLARFGAALTPEDHIRRADVVLYGAQGPAARELLPLLPLDHLALAQARMAYRANATNANDLAAALPPQFANHPGLAFERAAFYRKRNLENLALAQVRYFPTEAPHAEMADRIWDERYRLVLFALRNGDAQGAYAAAANSGLTSGGDAADAEFYAGWLALNRLRNPKQADIHFANLEKIGSSPITRGRALYWRGRAAEAAGDKAKAEGFYSAAARHNTTFYGLLAGEKVDGGRLTLGQDPTVTQADRARFEGRGSVRAARLLHEMGDKDRFRAFVLALDDVLPTAEEQALLVDLARAYGDQDTSMKVVRTAAQRGFILPGRGYPLRTPPQVMGAPETALTLGITRQESGFDPLVRSGVGARGMMQLMPATAALTARKAGMNYSPGMLDDPDYNMQLGQAYLGEMIGTFSGSYPMAIAAYNAGPGRPSQWTAFCGDPRGGSTDPVDFIECIPFSETRNYVMRVMEGMQVYRAKLNGGSAPITLSSDLRRGAYGTYAGPAQTTAPRLPIGGANTPIPNPQ